LKAGLPLRATVRRGVGDINPKPVSQRLLDRAAILHIIKQYIRRGRKIILKKAEK
jgi:hypothetical protein